jgi:transcriptional regulator with XRE-family HTH domain
MDALAPPLAVFTDYVGMVQAFRARRMELGLSQLAVDELAGLPSGYTAKIEISASNPTAKNARSIGKESLPLLLGALGLEMHIQPHARRSRASNNPNVSSALSRNLRKTFADMGRKGAIRLNTKLTPKQRRASARKAALARWSRERERREKKGSRT